ncbi:MAG: methyltransferase domain-containing protein [Gemmatimonadaceae bacterium]|nr:methyltransferase domain-containing protein [Gemmatimonadaceae bacterium]
MPAAEVETSLGHTPGERWAFDGAVASCFDDMLRRSIPQYDVMREVCFNVAARYVKPGTAIVDLGCSRGDAIARLVDRFGAQNRFVGVDVSYPMLEAARARFDGYIRCGVVDVKSLDLRREYPEATASVTLSVLTLQFTPMEYRQQIVRQVYRHTAPGGAFLLVEKVLGATAELDALMVDEYYRLKEANGYTADEIQRKRMSLEGVLVPVTAHWNEELLRSAGFTQVDCFWRWHNFAGWVAVRE